MQENPSFEALMKPGKAENFFDIVNLPPFDPAARTKYSRTNALWLMEFSRLIYRREIDEIDPPDGLRKRKDFLEAKDWREAAFINQGDTQVGLFTNDTLSCNVLIFRGTLGLGDTITDLEIRPVPWEMGGHVHDGFKEALDDVKIK